MTIYIVTGARVGQKISINTYKERFQMSNFMKNIISVIENEKGTDMYYKGYDMLYSYVYGCKYLAKKSSRERIQVCIEANFDYEEAVKMLSIRGIETNVASVRNSVCDANRILKDKLGEDIISRLNDCEYIILKLKLLENYEISGLLPIEVIDSMPEFKCIKHDIATCEKELLYLARFSLAAMAFYRECMDSNKLGYLLHLLTNPSEAEMPMSYVVRLWLSKARTAKLPYFEELLKLIPEAEELLSCSSENN